MEESERRHELTIIEKKMVVRCYTFLDKYKKEDCFARNRTRKLVELCIGMKEATVARVMQAYNENPDEVFQACIVAAGIIRTKGAMTTGHFVPSSIEVWNSTLKPKNMKADDYHGNFDAAKFEKWFLSLCKILKENCGGCNIHMDGASYHKRQINKAPTMKSNRVEIMNWLAKHVSKDIDFTQVKTKLVKIIALQPIELIWAQVKGQLGEPQLLTVQRVIAGLKNVEWIWLSLFRHVQGVEGKYAAVAKACQDDEAKSLANTDVADDCSADSSQN
ncbi:hypothetical protein PC119_g20580 [Phytophthora cactorum]|nr:hypothetical protein PC119_g20580 [Phytophthora cactorum]